VKRGDDGALDTKEGGPLYPEYTPPSPPAHPSKESRGGADGK